MAQERDNFWMAVIIGVVVMILFALITVNIFQLIPIFGPFIGGLVSGLIARKSIMNGGKAGLIAGIIGGVIVSIDFLLGTSFLQGSVAPFAAAAGSLVIIIAIIYFAILGWIGGAVGAVLRP